VVQTASQPDFLIRVAERADQPGYVVELVDNTIAGRNTKIATDTFDEAVTLANSIRRYVELGCPVAPLFGEEAAQ
jgi:hypothetical protein